ncbi:SH3 domain-containing protein [Dinoroseobacter sp. S76]|uniref:SH3 domain-containing protein n=1 Tax=Dinoroseobacter sp. S76 TaxID=3415124 RepID=UPI003C7CE5F9
MPKILLSLALCFLTTLGGALRAEPVFVQIAEPSAEGYLAAGPSIALRAEPTARGRVIAKLWEHQELWAMERSNAWTRVETGDGQLGFVQNDRLTRTRPAPAPVVDFINPERRAVFLRDAPSSTALPVIGMSVPGEAVFQVLAKHQSWILVRAEDGVVGWLPSKHTKFALDSARFTLRGATVMKPRRDLLNTGDQVWLGAFHSKSNRQVTRFEIEEALTAALGGAPNGDQIGGLDLIELEDGNLVYGPLSPVEAQQLLSDPAFRDAFKFRPLDYPGATLAKPHRGQARNLDRFGTPQGMDPAYPIYDFRDGCSFASARAEEGGHLNSATSVLTVGEEVMSWGDLMSTICRSFKAADQHPAHITLLDADRTSPLALRLGQAVIGYKIESAECVYTYRLDMKGLRARTKQTATPTSDGAACPVVLQDLRQVRIDRLRSEASHALEAVLSGTRQGALRLARNGEVLHGTYAFDHRVALLPRDRADPSFAAACRVGIDITRVPRSRTTRLAEGVIGRNNTNQIVYEFDLYGDVVTPAVVGDTFNLVGTRKSIRRTFTRNRGDGPPLSSFEKIRAEFPFLEERFANMAKETWKRLARFCATAPPTRPAD